MSVHASVKYSKILINKDRYVNHCDVSGTHLKKQNKTNPMSSFVMICLSLLIEFMLYLTLNNNIFMYAFIITLYFYKPTFMS